MVCSRKVHQHLPQTSEKCLNTQNISCLALYRCAGRFWECSQSWQQKFSKSDFSHKWYLAGLWIVCTHKVHQHVAEMSETHLKTQNIVKKADFVLCESTIFRDVEPISGMWKIKVGLFEIFRKSAPVFVESNRRQNGTRTLLFSTNKLHQHRKIPRSSYNSVWHVMGDHFYELQKIISQISWRSLFFQIFFSSRSYPDNA